MKTQFIFKGPLRAFGFYYSGPPWSFLLVVLLLALVLAGVIVVTSPVDIVNLLRCGWLACK